MAVVQGSDGGSRWWLMLFSFLITLQLHGSSKPIALPTLGRPFELGDLYNLKDDNNMLHCSLAQQRARACLCSRFPVNCVVICRCGVPWRRKAGRRRKLRRGPSLKGKQPLLHSGALRAVLMRLLLLLLLQMLRVECA